MRADHNRPSVIAVGDSLTAGYGLAVDDAFPAQLENRLRGVYPNATVQNAGVSGDTSASARARLPRLLSSLSARPDLAIVELGANDMLRGIPLADTRANLDEIFRALADCRIPTLMASMKAPKFLGHFARECDAIYSDLAAKHRLSIHPFFPAGVLGNRDLALPDRLHPNAKAINLIADHMLPAVLTALAKTDLGFVAA